MAKWQSRPPPRGKLNQEFPKSTRGRKRWLLWSYPLPPQRNHYLNVFVGSWHNKSLFFRFQRWLALSYRGSPRVGRVVCPHLRVLNDLIFLLQLVNTLCKGVRCVMIIKKGGNYRKRQDEAKDNCSKENVKTKVLLEGKGHLVEIVEDHFLWNHCHI